MKDSLDNIMKKKYSKIEATKLEYDFNCIKKNKFKVYNVYKIAVIIILFVVCIIGINNISKKNTDKIENNILSEEIALNSNEASGDILLPKPSETIILGINSDLVSIAKLNVEYVAVIKVKRIVGYTNYSKIQNKYMKFPITWLEVEVEECLKGDLYGTIKINKPGGVVSMSDYEKCLTEEQKENKGYNKKTEEEKRNTYIEIVTSLTLDMPDVEIGKSYLVFLKNDNEVYGGIGICGFFMKEYDKNINSIKNNKTWEKVEDSLLVKQAMEN